MSLFQLNFYKMQKRNDALKFKEKGKILRFEVEASSFCKKTD